MNELQANRAILKAACMRAIFNNDGSISDVRRSVLVQLQIPGTRGSMSLLSSAEFDLLPNLTETSARLPIGSVIEVWDGRLLASRRNNAADGYYRLETSDPESQTQWAKNLRAASQDGVITVENAATASRIPTQTERLF